jgi:predicted  nucleic acid-binding Zn-ribbon protein
VWCTQAARDFSRTPTGEDEVRTQLRWVHDEIIACGGAIRRVNDQIDAVDDQLKQQGLSEGDVAYLRDEKQQLRNKEQQLMDEKQQLMDEKQQLLARQERLETMSKRPPAGLPAVCPSSARPRM